LAALAHVWAARGGLDTGLSAHYYLLAAAIGLLATALPSYLLNEGMARVGAASTAMISNISPLFTIYFAVVLLGERFTLAHAAGTAMVIGGIGLHTWLDLRGGGPPPTPSAPAPEGREP
jgi:drug/metabolite transporter (DMT)-like permease